MSQQARFSSGLAPALCTSQARAYLSTLPVGQALPPQRPANPACGCPVTRPQVSDTDGDASSGDDSDGDEAAGRASDDEDGSSGDDSDDLPPLLVVRRQLRAGRKMLRL